MNIFQLETILDELQELRELRKAARQKIVDDYYAKRGALDFGDFRDISLLWKCVIESYVNNRPLSSDDYAAVIGSCIANKIDCKGCFPFEIIQYAQHCDDMSGEKLKFFRRMVKMGGVK